MAFVGGKVTKASEHDLTRISLLNLKQHTCDMRLLGFAVISMPLRADSASVISELQDRSAYIMLQYHVTAACGGTM